MKLTAVLAVAALTFAAGCGGTKHHGDPKLAAPCRTFHTISKESGRITSVAGMGQDLLDLATLVDQATGTVLEEDVGSISADFQASMDAGGLDPQTHDDLTWHTSDAVHTCIAAGYWH